MLTMAQCPHCLGTWPSGNALACHIGKCCVRIRLAACPHVKKQTLLHHSKTQPAPVQVVVNQQRAAATLRNATHTASTRNGRSTFADPLLMRAQVFEARCAVTPATDTDTGGCSLDDSVDDASDYHTKPFLDSDDQSHNVSVQAADDDEVEDLLSNDNN